MPCSLRIPVSFHGSSIRRGNTARESGRSDGASVLPVSPTICLNASLLFLPCGDAGLAGLRFAEEAPGWCGTCGARPGRSGPFHDEPLQGGVVLFALILMTAPEQAGDEELGQRVEAVVARLLSGVGGWQPLEDAAGDLSG